MRCIELSVIVFLNSDQNVTTIEKITTVNVLEIYFMFVFLNSPENHMRSAAEGRNSEC